MQGAGRQNPKVPVAKVAGAYSQSGRVIWAAPPFGRSRSSRRRDGDRSRLGVVSAHSGNDRCRFIVSLRDIFLSVVRGCEGSALAPLARTKSASPDLRSLRALPDRAVPLTDFLLAPPHPVSPTGRGS